MIPAQLVEHVHGAVLMFVGTRDAKLRPAASWAFGALVDARADRITFYLPEAEGATMLANIADNGRVAFTVTEPHTHTTYQFKGRSSEVRQLTDADRAVRNVYMAKTAASLKRYGLPDSFLAEFVTDPARAVTFAVEDVFVQTPGPRAGEKVPF